MVSKNGTPFDNYERGRLYRILHGFTDPLFDFWGFFQNGIFSWQSSPFSTGVDKDGDYALVLGPDGTNSRFFLAADYSSAGGIGFGSIYGLVSTPYSTINGYYAGIRIDDGTDTNYVEFTMEVYASGASRTFRTRVVYGQSGGPTTYYNTFEMDQGTYLLNIQVNGSAWSSWNPSCIVFREAAPIWVNENIGNLTWTPDRVGFVFGSDGTTPSTWMSATFYQLHFSE